MSNENQNKDFKTRIVGVATKWALYVCGILLVLSVSIKISGVDLAHSIKDIVDANTNLNDQ